MQSNSNGYLASIAAELDAEASRVRHLIGGAHWPSDGTHKEAVLARVISRHVPRDVLISRGFVISGTRDDLPSREQDILLADEHKEPPLFHEHGLLMTSPRNVLAAISVKSEFQDAKLRDSIETWQTVVQRTTPFETVEPILFAAFFFNSKSPSGTQMKASADLLRTNAVGVPSHCEWGPGLESIIVCATGQVFLTSRTVSDERQVSLLDCGAFAPVLLLANLANQVSLRRKGSKPDIVQRLEDLAFPQIGLGE